MKFRDVVHYLYVLSFQNLNYFYLQLIENKKWIEDAEAAKMLNIK